jgi:hypothetical protein
VRERPEQDNPLGCPRGFCYMMPFALVIDALVLYGLWELVRLF